MHVHEDKPMDAQNTHTCTNTAMSLNVLVAGSTIMVDVFACSYDVALLLQGRKESEKNKEMNRDIEMEGWGNLYH